MKEILSNSRVKISMACLSDDSNCFSCDSVRRSFMSEIICFVLSANWGRNLVCIIFHLLIPDDSTLGLEEGRNAEVLPMLSGGLADGWDVADMLKIEDSAALGNCSGLEEDRRDGLSVV